jgi:hypothetical protein
VVRLLLRAAPWRALLGLAAAGAAVGAGGLAIGGGSGMRVVQLGLVLLGATSACALDEAAAAVVSACPVRREVQVLARALSAAVGLVVGAVLAVSWWWLEATDRLLLVELGGTWLLGFALAALSRRRLDEPAEVVVSGLVLSLMTLMMYTPISRHVVLFPIGEPGDRATRTWAVVTVVAVVGLVLAVRERRWR